jgi:hypothetical protein
MTTWTMIVVIGQWVFFGGASSGHFPATTTAVFADRPACEAAIVATRAIAAKVLPRLSDNNFPAVCVPSASAGTTEAPR